MTTVVNNPSGGESSGMGMVIGVILAIILIALFFIYALPAIRGNNDGGVNLNVDLPDGNGGGVDLPPANGNY